MTTPMKNFFKAGLIFLMIVLPIISSAQKLSIKAGANFSNMRIKKTEIFAPYDTQNELYKANTGFHAGATIDYPIRNLFFIESGLFFSTKGTWGTIKESFGEVDLITSNKHDLIYLDIPLLIKVPISWQGFSFYGAAGGYAGAGLFGNTKSTSTFGELKETENGTIKWGSETGEDDYKRFDYGLSFGAGFNWKSFTAGLNYNYGLANLSPESAGGGIINNRVLCVSLGYMFGELKRDQIKSDDKIKEAATDKKVKSSRPVSRKMAEQIEAERLMKEKIRTDSLSAVTAEQERLRIAKARAKSIETSRALAAKAEAKRLEMEKIKSDSITAVKKNLSLQATGNIPVYRVQFASSTTKKGSYSINVGGKAYKTREYFYSGAYRSTAGEFKTYKEALAFQNVMRKSGFTQAFVVAFINDKRTTDPVLFK